MGSKTSLFHKLFNTEIPDISSRWGRLERILLISFILVFTITFVRVYPGIFLGFGFGDEFQWALIAEFFEQLKQQNTILFFGACGLLIFNVLFRMRVFLLGQLAYRSNHPDLPIKTILLFVGANSLNVVFVSITTIGLGLVAYMLGNDFITGFNAEQNLLNYALELADQVPTIVELPLIIAFVLTYMVQGFFHYWIHRLCHLNRFLWLTLHRFHHVPPILTVATTTVVITSIPFFIGIVFAKTLLFAALSKLFFERQLFMEIFFYHLVMWIPEAYSHQTAMFKEGIKSRWIRILSFIAGTGVYHYLHHSRDAEIVSSNTTNQVNIGGGMGFFWDMVFGTFKGLPNNQHATPNVGLWGNPTLHHNPLRLLLSGLMQLIYEVTHNKGILNKLKCVFCSVNYVPQITRKYHISEGTEAQSQPSHEMLKGAKTS